MLDPTNRVLPLRGRAAPSPEAKRPERDGDGVVLPRSRVVLSRESIVADYRLAVRSRAASRVARREVLSGRARFAIVGDGKEVAQLALARVMRPGDWRSGYYRDQTLAMATGMVDLRGFFAQMYGDADTRDDLAGGRQMTSHFATRTVDADGRHLDLLLGRNSASDMSPVAAWMPRLVGLGYASRLYRESRALDGVAAGHSERGGEVAFGTIGDASTSEGLFWESMNAIALLQVPVLLSVWDDGYGISVPTELQTVKGSISAALRGFETEPGEPGLRIERVAAWDYVALCDTYATVVETVRRDHEPALVHVYDCTQPSGHSSSGSHERYKSAPRLQWEHDFDCVARMRTLLLDTALATTEELQRIEKTERRFVEDERQAAENAFRDPIRAERDGVVALLRATGDEGAATAATGLAADPDLTRRTVDSVASRAAWALRDRPQTARPLTEFLAAYRAHNRRATTSHLLSETRQSPLRTALVPPRLGAVPQMVDARVVLQRCFDANFARDPRLLVIGEDVGRLGDVNLVFEGLQQRFGELRVTDTGIREATILGQAIGMALRGLRPIADIQYIDYFLYALQLASDDLSTLRWRTVGAQSAPVVIRTKGHRLQGVWHAGSPMSTIMSSCRGMHLCVPRDCTRAAGLYNTLFRGDDPGMVVEVLNGYRLKEALPDNVGEFTIPLGRPEVLRAGTDVTVVTYGACVRLALEAADLLAGLGVEAEVIDVQTLMPFDLDGAISASLARTGALVVVDEDVPGGASAAILQQVLETQKGWWHLDAAPRTLSGAPTRTGYAIDAEYYAKPSIEEIVRTVYATARERQPRRLPELEPGSGQDEL